MESWETGTMGKWTSEQRTRGQWTTSQSTMGQSGRGTIDNETMGQWYNGTMDIGTLEKGTIDRWTIDDGTMGQYHNGQWDNRTVGHSTKGQWDVCRCAKFLKQHERDQPTPYLFPRHPAKPKRIATRPSPYSILDNQGATNEIGDLAWPQCQRFVLQL